MTARPAGTAPAGMTGYLGRLGRLADIKARQAQQIRNADNTSRGERAAGEADLDAAAIRWALRRLNQERQAPQLTSDSPGGRQTGGRPTTATD